MEEKGNTTGKEQAEIDLLLLPGLGGDRRMAYPQLELPYRIVALDLIAMREHETLEEYAGRFAECIDIGRDRPIFVGGYSFGSAVATELSTLLKVRGLIIIGGLQSGDELRPLVRFFGAWVAPLLPNVVLRALTPLVRVVMKRYSRLSAFDLELSIEMYRAFPKQLFRRALTALVHWQSKNVNIPMLRIHGDRDQLIKRPASNADTVVLPAKHLVHFTCAAEVNRVIQDFVDRTVRGEL